jgi:hypothetical protein
MKAAAHCRTAKRGLFACALHTLAFWSAALLRRFSKIARTLDALLSELAENCQ